jgi:hypothetical protein
LCRPLVSAQLFLKGPLENLHLDPESSPVNPHLTAVGRPLDLSHQGTESVLDFLDGGSQAAAGLVESLSMLYR